MTVSRATTIILIFDWKIHLDETFTPSAVYVIGYICRFYHGRNLSEIVVNSIFEFEYYDPLLKV